MPSLGDKIKTIKENFRKQSTYNSRIAHVNKRILELKQEFKQAEHEFSALVEKKSERFVDTEEYKRVHEDIEHLKQLKKDINGLKTVHLHNNAKMRDEVKELTVPYDISELKHEFESELKSMQARVDGSLKLFQARMDEFSRKVKAVDLISECNEKLEDLYQEISNLRKDIKKNERNIMFLIKKQEIKKTDGFHKVVDFLSGEK